MEINYKITFDLSDKKYKTIKDIREFNSTIMEGMHNSLQDLTDINYTIERLTSLR